MDKMQKNLLNKTPKINLQMKEQRIQAKMQKKYKMTKIIKILQEIFKTQAKSSQKIKTKLLKTLQKMLLIKIIIILTKLFKILFQTLQIQVTYLLAKVILQILPIHSQK